MAIIFEDQLDRLKGGESSEFAHARSEILRPAYDLYLESAHVRKFSPPPSILQLIASPDIAVKLSRCRKTGAAIDLTITKKSNASYENFMGYCKDHRCVVFKGETGLFYDFVDFVESAAAKHGINDTTAVLRAPDKIRIPFGGLKYGLEYEQFVDLVEVLQCAMWIRTSPSGIAYLLSISASHRASANNHQRTRTGGQKLYKNHHRFTNSPTQYSRVRTIFTIW